MNKDIKQMWIEALRSGEYKQGTRQLRSFTHTKGVFEYCCLGVLCDLYIKHTGQGSWREKDNALLVSTLRYPEHDALPGEIRAWAGLDEARGDPIIGPTGGPPYTAIHYNDTLEYNFNQIADLIEANL